MEEFEPVKGPSRLHAPASQKSVPRLSPAVRGERKIERKRGRERSRASRTISRVRRCIRPDTWSTPEFATRRLAGDTAPVRQRFFLTLLIGACTSVLAQALAF